MLNGVVAEQIELAGYVQPFISSMKMAKDTVNSFIEAIDTFNNSTSNSTTMDNSDADNTDGSENRSLRSLQQQEEQVIGPNDPVKGLSEPVKDVKFPTATVTLCPGVLSKEDYYEFMASTPTEITDGMISWILDKFGSVDEAQDEVRENFFWSASNMEEQGWEPTERAMLWDDAVSRAFSDDACRSVYTNQLSWNVQLGVSHEDLHAFVMAFQDTNDAGNVDSYCVLGMLAGLSAYRLVCQMELTPTQTVSNDKAQWLIQTGVENERPFFDRGLNGTGQVVAVSDTGVDRDNCYFGDSTKVSSGYSDAHPKIVLYDDWVDSQDYEYGHGTHVASSIVGNRQDGQDGQGQGIAPGAKLAFIDIGFPNGALALPPDSRLLGTGRDPFISPMAHLHSASWGVIGENGYNYQCRSFDSYMWQNDDFLVLIAAGNDGRYDATNTVSAPSTAKNSLSIGASHSFGDDRDFGMLGPAHVADFSSRGPTADGRIKPDILGPGKYIVGAGARPTEYGECDDGRPGPGDGRAGLKSMMGTSMATPIVAGTAALVRQYLEEGWHETGEKDLNKAIQPSGALVKAILMNGAQTDILGIDNSAGTIGTSVTPSQPYDDAQGFGRVSLTNSLYLRGKTDVQIKFWDSQSILYNGEWSQSLKIDQSNGCTNSRLSITLVWADPPATTNCLRCLVNDLDLQVVKSGNSTRFYPNGLTSRDSINNAERIIIEDVRNGDDFTISVVPYNLDTMSQKFAVVATGCFGGIANTIDTSQNVYATDNSEAIANRNLIIIICSVLAFVIICIVVVVLRRRRRSKSEYE